MSRLSRTSIIDILLQNGFTAALRNLRQQSFRAASSSAYLLHRTRCQFGADDSGILPLARFGNGAMSDFSPECAQERSSNTAKRNAGSGHGYGLNRAFPLVRESEIARGDALVGGDVGGRAVEDEFAKLHHIGAVGDFQRGLRVLLDQQH
jgi:hypothetical protein